MADLNGYIGASVPGLADRARVSLDACLQALECFRAPDKWSRSQEFDGRRIADVEGGWVLLNHAKYRAMRDAEVRKEQVKQAVARFRAKPKDDVITGNQSNPCKPVKAQADTEADTDTKKQKNSSPTGSRMAKDFVIPNDWKAWAKKKRPELDIEDEAESFVDYWTEIPGAKGRRAGWKGTWQNWIRRANGKPGVKQAPQVNTSMGASPQKVKTPEQEQSDRIDGLRHMAHLGNADAIAKLQQMGIPA